MRHSLATRQVWIAVGIAGALVAFGGILITLLVGRDSAGSSEAPLRPSCDSPAPQPSDRVLVFIVPGTYGNQWFWPSVIPGKVTFASELQSTLGSGSKVYPFLWASSVYHEKRVEAAQNLAALIDRDADRFDRVCLVGHSHGGNVALMAAALCRHKVDTIITLSTPHPYLRTIGADGASHPLPIYCSLRTVANTDRILSIAPTADSIPDTWSTEALTGLTENEAIRLTTDWREALNYPRLANDNLTFRLFESRNIVAEKNLPALYDRESGKGILSCSVCSFVSGSITAHSCIHSRRMGRVVGEVIRDRVRPERFEYLCHLVQPANEDDGEPISEAEDRRMRAGNEPLYEHAGWLLDRIDIRLDPQAKEAAGEGDPDPYVVIAAPNGKDWSLRTDTRWNAATTSWSPGYFFPDGTALVFQVWDANHVASNRCLGSRSFALERNPPPKDLPADAAAHVYWSGTLEWVPMHY